MKIANFISMLYDLFLHMIFKITTFFVLLDIYSLLTDFHTLNRDVTLKYKFFLLPFFKKYK